MAAVFGNRYATMQFEGYARSNGDSCDLLSMGGLCGLVESRHAAIPEASKLRLLGALGDREGRALRMRSFALPPPLLAAAQADISKWLAAGPRLHNIAAQFALSETVQAHLAVEKGDKLGTVIVDCAR